MAADWHPANSFKILVLHLFSGGFYAGCASYPMVNCNIVNIRLRVIKQCGMYAKEYKAQNFCKVIRPKIVETIETFKDF